MGHARGRSNLGRPAAAATTTTNAFSAPTAITAAPVISTVLVACLRLLATAGAGVDALGPTAVAAAAAVAAASATTVRATAFEQWVNCTHMACGCANTPDCYGTGQGVCMRLHTGETTCRFCPHGHGLLYHLADEPLPEGVPAAKLCLPVTVCHDTRCFEGACRHKYTFHSSHDSRCECRDGYTAERLTPGVERCVDVDECALASRSVGGSSSGSVGSSSSISASRGVGAGGMGGPSPPSGYALAVGVCPPHSRCVNTVGSFECHCLDGYRMRFDAGLVCEDVDECATLGFAACPWHLACMNEAGGFRCANPLHDWMSDEVFVFVLLAVALLVLNVLVCWTCRQLRRGLGYEDRLPIRQRQKELDKYSVARL